MLALIHLELNLLDDSCRIAGYNGHRRHILCHDRVGTDYAAVVERDAGKNSGVDAEPNLVLDLDWFAVGCASVVGIDIVVDGNQVALRADKHIIADFYASTSEQGAALLDEAPFADTHWLAVVYIGGGSTVVDSSRGLSSIRPMNSWTSSGVR